MNPFKKAERRSILASECGQMAIFIALIFQVLFVFFAMVINIGLLVHDKINLQNSVDLGAYYGAQKQAEMLNEIGQINYQMRQDYKLLAWRSRVLGTFGRSTHPLHTDIPPNNDVSYVDPMADTPGICVTHQLWKETTSGENLCQHPSKVKIPEIPSIKIDFPAPYNFILQNIVEGIKKGYEGRCDEAGPLNWVFTVQMLQAFRNSGAIRKRMIGTLAKNMSQPIEAGSGSFRDKNLDPVYTGIQNTILNNLTQANRDSDFQLEVMNGLSQGDCGQLDGEYPKWIREIPIDPVLYYMNFINGGGCESQVLPHMYVPGSMGPDKKMVAGDPKILDKFDPSGNLRYLAQSEPPLGSYEHSSRGFEKNPWCLAYVGVKAKSKPRKPFSPFGAPITLEARAFASPFGGRVGPWEFSAWPSGSDFSGGERVDKLAVPKTTPSAGVPDPILSAPNYSRFPGDVLGLKSRMALATMRGAVYEMAKVNLKTEPLTAQVFNFNDVGTLGDVLAWDARPGFDRAPWVRNAEIAAVSPDVFDVTYYSVEPTYFANYFSFGAATRFGKVTPISDVGSRLAKPAFQAFGVREQISTTQTMHLYSPDAYWIVKNPSHLLTGWTQQTATNYSFPKGLFGTCGADDRPKPGKAPTTGDCFGGGRTGYAVRLVHKDYLLSKNHAFGGAVKSGGPLRNAPPSDF